MNTIEKNTRIAGFGYLIIKLAGAFVKILIPSTLFVSGDPQTKVNSKMANDWLFHIGFASNLIVLMCEVMVALTLYILLKPVNKSLVLIGALFCLTHTVIYGINLLDHFFSLFPIRSSNYLNIYE
jgi:hypothetical protein